MCHSFNAETNKRFHETMPLHKHNALAKQKICSIYRVLTARLRNVSCLVSLDGLNVDFDGIGV